jgi:hypothetical protein
VMYIVFLGVLKNIEFWLKTKRVLISPKKYVHGENYPKIRILSP